ncbi:uncharacterized protein LOC111343004 [Stylophora pistillata]|uniref:Uncharacterized protein n=1 Tax=Stylophora pistillata TaxID=50429 RepID=A0A2B4SVE2_STYPI|nr:uncharacterized protein LOC111343004 [Stylophora pistillata]PFX33149.1 hypothetical protein AWC38_SpisGene1967 [Stylophora pistillata]
MATVRHKMRKRRDGPICLKDISMQQEIGGSAENIPRAKFENCPSVGQNGEDLRRTRSFSLPRMLKKPNDTQTLLQILLGTKTRLKKSNSNCATLFTNTEKDKGLNQEANCTKVSVPPSQIDDSKLKQNNFVIPTIYIQPPEEVDRASHLTHPIITLEQADTTQQLANDQTQDSMEDPKQASTLSRSETTTTTAKRENKTTPRRKRSFSWSDIYTIGNLRISPSEVMKGSSSWSDFLNSAARETDLCSTDL